MTYLQWVNALGALAALAAAIFWLMSALMRVPRMPLTADLTEIPLDKILRRQSTFSAFAAGFAAIAAILQSYAIYLQM
jgi:hypothetical protein